MNKNYCLAFTCLIAAVLAGGGGSVADPQKTPADRVALLLENPNLLQGNRDILELAQNISRSCQSRMQQLITELLAKLASVKYELGNELKYPFPVSRRACLAAPWANELFPNLARGDFILEEVSKALCAQNYAVRCDATDIKPAGDPDVVSSLPTEPYIEVNISLPPLPDVAQLKAMSEAGAKLKKPTVECKCP